MKMNWIQLPCFVLVFLALGGTQAGLADEKARRMKAQRLLKVDPIRIADLEKATAVHLENRKTVIQHAISVVSSEKESR